MIPDKTNPPDRATACFLLSKDPVADHGGDVELSRLVMELAAQTFEVSAICLSHEPAGTLAFEGVPLVRVAKSGVQPLRLLLDVVRTRRSLVHARFDNDDLVAAIDAAGADIYVAEHSYMAESFLRSSRVGKSRFVVNTHVSESLVWRATRGGARPAAGREVAPRRTEGGAGRRCGGYLRRRGSAVLSLPRGVRDARWMDITLPPAMQVAVASTPRRLVLMGTRDWPPNQEAFEEALRLWPRIAEGIDGAELCVIGAKAANAPEPQYPPGGYGIWASSTTLPASSGPAGR